MRNNVMWEVLRGTNPIHWIEYLWSRYKAFIKKMHSERGICYNLQGRSIENLLLGPINFISYINSYVNSQNIALKMEAGLLKAHSYSIYQAKTMNNLFWFFE